MTAARRVAGHLKQNGQFFVLETGQRSGAELLVFINSVTYDNLSRKHDRKEAGMLKVAIIGAGFMGKLHADCYRHVKGARLVKVADVDLARAQELGKTYNISVTQDLDEIISDPEIDIVDVCVPTYLHREYVVKAAQAGKHVLCEKPIALSLIDAEQMLVAARKANVKFMVAHVVRFWPEYKKLKEIYDSKELGNLVSLTMTRLATFPSSLWYSDPKKSGGAMLDLHVHDADFLLYLLGKPEWVFAQGTLNHLTTMYGYPEIEMVTAEGGFMPSRKFPFRMAFRAVFERGVVDFNSLSSPSLLIYQEGKEPEPYEFAPLQQIKGDYGGNISVIWPYLFEIQYFVDCVKHGKELKIASGTSGKEALELILAEKRSLESGKKVKCR